MGPGRDDYLHSLGSSREEGPEEQARHEEERSGCSACGTPAARNGLVTMRQRHKKLHNSQLVVARLGWADRQKGGRSSKHKKQEEWRRRDEPILARYYSIAAPSRGGDLPSAPLDCPAMTRPLLTSSRRAVREVLEREAGWPGRAHPGRACVKADGIL